VGEDAEGNALGDEAAAGPGRRGRRDGLQVGGHLPCDHFEEAGAVHPDGLAVVSGVLHRDELAGFVHRTAQGDAIGMIDGQMVEPLCEHKNFGNAVAQW